MCDKAILTYKVNYINSTPPGRPESPKKVIDSCSYCKSTCGWCIGSLIRTFIVSTVEVAGLSLVRKEQNLFS